MTSNWLGLSQHMALLPPFCEVVTAFALFGPESMPLLGDWEGDGDAHQCPMVPPGKDDFLQRETGSRHAVCCSWSWQTRLGCPQQLGCPQPLGRFNHDLDPSFPSGWRMKICQLSIYRPSQHHVIHHHSQPSLDFNRSNAKMCEVVRPWLVRMHAPSYGLQCAASTRRKPVADLTEQRFTSIVHIRTHTHMYIYIHMYAYIIIYICMYANIYIYMCVYVHIHWYT
jgi:hypothetical protein